MTDPFSRFLPSALVSSVTYLTIFILGLQFAYYLIFLTSYNFDDEGTFMLQVNAFIKSGGNFDVVGEYHGPFYYLVKYLIHYVTNTDISHNTNRLTTIAFWSLIPVVCAFFVHRLTGFLILAAIVQLQLISLFAQLTSSAGHPQELILLFIAAALLFSSFVGSRQSSVFPIAGIAGIVGALLLVKINIGVYLGAGLALSIVMFLPPRKLTLAIFALAAVAAVLLPVSIIGNFIYKTELDRNYCLQVTLVITACLVASKRNWPGVELRWADVGAAAFALLCTVFLVCGVTIALGGSLGGIVDTVLLRAWNLKGSDIDHYPVEYSDINVAFASVLLAIGYRLLVPKIETSGHWLLVLSVLKLSYGLVTLYAMYSPVPPHLPFQTLSFIWIVLIPPYSPPTITLANSFPRVFLCFSAAFQSMQAFPVAGVQVYWSVFLLAPLAAICIGDAFSFLCTEFDRRRLKARARGFQPTLRWVIQLAVLCCIIIWYWQKLDIGRYRAVYLSQPSVGLDGADRIHLPKGMGNQIRKVVADLREHCDGFVGIPGMPSLYFWTGIQPAEVITDHWIFNMEVERQKHVIKSMEEYEKSCVIYNPEKLNVWIKPDKPPGWAEDSRREITNMPLMNYINDQYTVVRKIAGYQILEKNDTPVE